MDADVEDKTCRICGFVDTSNINIFDNKWNNLLRKILTVFPIIIYETDPLPKNICRKCVTNVSLMFEETSKLFKVQKKWIDNVRQNQPNHPYFKIIDLIKTSNHKMLSEARKFEPNFPHREPRIYPNCFTANDDIKDVMPVNVPPQSSSGSQSFFKGRMLHEEMSLKRKDFAKKIIDPISPAFSVLKSKDISLVPKKVSPSPEKQSTSPNTKPAITDQIKELQHKLQSNGCTLMSLSYGNKIKPSMTNISRFAEKCKFCHGLFPTANILAKHQLVHMTVSDRRIFDKKYLEKKVRRGRLIPKGDKKCIRCLNCWKLFLDHRCILDHWSNGECDFYCQICGKEFANNPKMLREHVPAAHGISYKSSRRRLSDSPGFATGNGTSKDDLMNLDFPKEVKIKTEPIDDTTKDYLNYSPPFLYRPKSEKQKTNSKSSKVRCHICGMEFSNFRSKNSHMRKHKNRNPPPPPKPEPPTEFIIKQEKLEPPEEELMQVDELEAVNSEITTPDEQYDIKPRLQVKKLSDLQDPLVTSQYPDTEEQKVTKVEPNDESTEKANKAEDHMEYGKIYNCHPCGKKFSSKTELFEHKRQCQSNNKFACGFCLRAFITSADLQMHIMLMHRDS